MIGSEGTLGFISEITYRTVEEHADKASALILFDDLETACSAVTLLKQHAGGRRRAARPRGAALGARTSRACPTALRALPARRRGAAGRDARRDRGGARRARSRAIDAALAGVAARSTPLRFSTDAAECARLLERAQGHVPVGRRDAPDRHHGDHRGRGLPGRRAWPRPRSTCSGCSQRTATPRPSSSATRSRATCTSSSRRTSAAPPRSSATAASWTRCADMVVEQVRRLAQGRARHRPQHGALRRAGMGRARPTRLMRRDQGAVRPAGPAQPGRDPQRRPEVAPEEPEAAARRRRARRQVHRVRLLRAQVPVARADAVAAPAHRRLARDRAARAAGDEPRRTRRD